MFFAFPSVLPLALLAQTTARARHGQETPPSAAPVLPLAISCPSSIRDQADPTACLAATSVPTVGLLFPGPHLGGQDNVQSGADSFVGGGRNNTASGYVAVIGGGRQNQATDGDTTVGGGFGNNASGVSATVAGGALNYASDAVATVGGGQLNFAGGYYATVAGGSFNSAAYVSATVGGGAFNGALQHSSTVGGGYSNTASEAVATIGGGFRNTASGLGSTVGGGEFNYATANGATVAGGAFNTAMGPYSFASGRRAKANHAGAFVWADSQNVNKTSSAADEFNVYASGGARIFSNAAATTGVLLAPGGGSWSSVSDRASKENLEPVDVREVLTRVCALPISTWNYEAQGESVRHMGPMAQDFHAAFGLGASDRMIDTIDPDGVAFAALQALKAENDELRGRVDALEVRLARLESALPAATVPR